MTTETSNPPSYLQLDAARIVATMNRLAARIAERFPDSGLARVAAQMASIAQQTQRRIEMTIRPVIWIRALIVVFLLLLSAVIALGIAVLVRLQSTTAGIGLVDFVQAIESTINDLLLTGAGLYFLLTLERRYKRGQALRALHELRSLAHVIDMHQLTKDPERFVDRWTGTDSSPQPELTAAQLNRYLDYCSELLSLAGKVAALYAQNFDDPVVLTAVNEIEDLTTGLSRKIWQKIIVLNTVTTI